MLGLQLDTSCCLLLALQALYRGRLARTRFAHMRRESAALTIQTMWRMRQARRAFVAHREAASVLQRLFRCRVARKELLHLRAEVGQGSAACNVCYQAWPS